MSKKTAKKSKVKTNPKAKPPKKNLLKSRKPSIKKVLANERRIELYDDFAKMLQPPPIMTIAEYADGHIYLPPPNPFPGYYDISRTPYVRPILEALSPTDPARVVIIVMGTQMGKSTTLQMAFMFYIEHSPAPMIFGFPNDKEGKKFFKTRIMNLIEANPSIKACVGSSNRGSKGMTLDQIEFLGGFLNRASGEASASLKSTPAQFVSGDEYDEWNRNIENQGTGFDLLSQRVKNYSGREKIAFSSTPTNNESPIMALLSDTTNEHFFVTCPHCGELIEFEWLQFKYISNGERCSEVWYECQKCKGRIEEYQRDELVREAKCLPTAEKDVNPTWRGFWIPAYYGPMTSWIDMIETYLKAKTKEHNGSYEAITSFYNNILAIPYEVVASRPDHEKMMSWANHREYAYYRYSTSGTFPKDVLFLTSGTDVQENRLETEVKGWCRNGKSMSVEHYVFPCEQGMATKDLSSNCWKEYTEKIVNMRYLREDGVELGIAFSAIDRSYISETVQAYCASVDPLCRRVIPVIGTDRMNDEVSKLHIQNKTLPTGEIVKEMYRRVGVSRLKGEAYAHFRLPYDKDDFGICMFPCDYDEEYFLQLVSEDYVPKKNGKGGEWVLNKTRNEGLDLHVYNLAMWYYGGLPGWKEEDYDQHEAKLQAMAKGITKQKIATKRYLGRQTFKTDLTL